MPLYYLLKCLLPLCHALFVEKGKTKYQKRCCRGKLRQTIDAGSEFGWECLEVNNFGEKLYWVVRERELVVAIHFFPKRSEIFTLIIRGRSLPSLVCGSSTARQWGTWDLDSDGFLLWVFFAGFVFFVVIGPCGPPPSPRVDFLAASSYCCVNYT